MLEEQRERAESDRGNNFLLQTVHAEGALFYQHKVRKTTQKLEHVRMALNEYGVASPGITNGLVCVEIMLSVHFPCHCKECSICKKISHTSNICQFGRQYTDPAASETPVVFLHYRSCHVFY
ncbi:unnamed protein product [Lepidochelys kempii]